MLTECPSCLTVFRVTGAILKMGHGQVRCGKCRKQFDAIECMLEDEDVETPPTATPTTPPTTPPTPPVRQALPQQEEESEFELSRDSEPLTEPKSASEPVSETETSHDLDGDVQTEDDFGASTYAEEITMEGSRIEISGTYQIPNNNASPEKIIRERVVIDRGDLRGIPARDRDDAVHEIDDVMGEIHATEAGEAELDPDSDDGEPVAQAAEHLFGDFHGKESPTEASVRDAPAVPNRWRRALHLGRKHENEEIHAELHALTQAERPRVLRTGVWATIAAFLALMLVAQVVHHNRDALVRDPTFGNTVSRIYRMLGLSPTPHWDLSAYQWDIYKVGLDPKIPEALRVVGSVANNAPFAQPYPLGKLSLKDRWESPVGVRAFEPSEYLPSPESADRLMAPKQRVNIEIVIADPGPDAVGYLIHACLQQDRELRCADDLAAR